MKSTAFGRLALMASVLTLCVVVLGAYVRLSDAGLGCPDWPGCYGQLGVPGDAQQLARANAQFPERPVETAKAWKEMVHRYLAGILGIMILILGIQAWRHRREPGQPLILPWLLVGLVIFQALLGMWTVTLLLKPAVVMAHLLGGLATLALLWWLALRQGVGPRPVVGETSRSLRIWALGGLLVLVVQIALGGWTSANYAALVCPDFPTCQGQWWPSMDISEAFILWRGIGISYEGGVLDNEARVAIHMVHRLGALVVLLYLAWMIYKIVAATDNAVLRRTAAVIGLLLTVQISLGIANVVFLLPLPLAVAHNAVAALLVLALVILNHELRPQEGL